MFVLTKRQFVPAAKRSLRGCRFKLSLGLCLFEDGFCVDLFGFMVALPFLDRLAYEPEEMMESWGFCFYERAIHFNWGHRCRIVGLPWEWKQVRHEVLKLDGSWAPYVGHWEEKEPDGRMLTLSSYRYQLKNGNVQHRWATVYVERRERRWRGLAWLPWPSRKQQSICVSFDAEVGERTGSWKGGVMGCGYEMMPGELALDTLRRMERERVFN